MTATSPPGQPGVGGLARRLAFGLALLAVCAGPVAPAEAQTVRDLVSNNDKTFGSAVTRNQMALAFRVGLHHNDYILTHVDIRFDDNNAATNVDVEIWSRGNSTREPRSRMTWFGPPGSRLLQLTNPGDVSGGGLKRFTAPAGTRLGFGAYFVVIRSVGSTRPSISLTSSNGQTHASGTKPPTKGDFESHWLIGDGYYYRLTGGDPWSTHTNVPGITVRGYARPYSSNNKLSGIGVADEGGATVAFEEPFDPDKGLLRRYVEGLGLLKLDPARIRSNAQVVRVPDTTEAVTLTPVPEDAAVPRIAFHEVSPSLKEREVAVWRTRPYSNPSEGPPSHRFELERGRNTFLVQVLAQAKIERPNGVMDSDRYYYVHIDRAVSAGCQAGDVWCATLTVGDARSGRLGYFGRRGALSADTFAFRGASYTAEQVTVGSSGNLVFKLTPDGDADFERPGFALVVGGKQFPLDGRFSGSDRGFEWRNAGLDWSVGNEVRLRLVRADSTGPKLRSARTDGKGKAVILRFDEALDGDASHAASAEDFTVTVGAEEVRLGDVSTDGTTVRLTLQDPAPIRRSHLVAVSHRNEGDMRRAVRDTYGNEAARFTGVAVDNRSNVFQPACRDGDIWCATMRVGKGTERSGGFKGGRVVSQNFYGFEADRRGSLSDRSFDFNGTTYDIRFLVEFGGALKLSLDPSGGNAFAGHRDLRLVVDGKPFSFKNEDVFDFDRFKWPDSGLSWSQGDTVELRLVEPTGPGPKLVSAETNADGDAVILRFNEALAFQSQEELGRLDPADTFADSSNFRVKVNGRSVSFDSARFNSDIDPRELRLILGEGEGETIVEPRDRVSVSYRRLERTKNFFDEDTNQLVATVNFVRALRNRAGTEAREFTDVEVRNLSTEFFRSVCQPTDLWCAELTVEELLSGGLLFGHGFHEDLSGGVLTDSDFSFDGVDYSVTGLFQQTGLSTVQIGFVPDGRNVFGGADFTLVLDGTPYTFDGGTYHQLTNTFLLDGTNLGWSDGRTVSVRLVGPVGQQAPPSNDPLTASLADAPGDHDGQTPFKVRVAFSEDIRTSPEDLGDGFSVTGGSITAVRRVEEQSDLWELDVEPSGDADVVVTLEGGRACSVTGAPCTGDGRTLSETLTFTVAGRDEGSEPVRPLDAYIDHAPAEHDGSSRFEVRVGFTEPIANSRKHVDDAATASGGRVTSAKRHNGQSDMWNLRVYPDGNGPVTLTLAGGGTCGETHPAVLCTANGRALMEPVSVTVPGPEAISVADATANESDGSIEFTVSLDRPAIGTVTVDYATRDGTAAAGEDYTETEGTLTFEEGDETKTVSVALIDDAVDEGEETFTLVLSNPVGAWIADGTATGTIENDDPLQKMWLSRFGRTVADHVTAAVSDRLGGPLEGAQATVGGQSVDLARTDDEAWLAQTMTSLARALGAPHGPAPEGDDWPGTGLGAGESPTPAGAAMREISGRELLLGSAFHLARDAEGTGPGLAAWGRVTAGGFDGEAPAGGGTLRIDGEVTTGILGADAEWNRLLAGVAISVSEGEGTFDQRGVDSGTVESTMTTVSPYARVSLNNRVSVWGLAGWGTGDMTIVQAANDRGQPERTTRTDLEMRLAAVGGRGALMQADEAGGFDLALKADAFLVETEADAVSNEGSTVAEASRVRLVLEGGRAFAMDGGATLRPSMELGLRHDGGDAETGTGVELGGGVSYTDPATGLSVEAKARMLVAHADSDYEEWGASGAVRLAPGERGRGLSFSLAPTVGAASSAAQRLWGAQNARGLAPDGTFEAEQRLEGELGYGLGLFGDRFTGTPNVGFGLSDSGRDYRIGWRLNSAIPGDPGFEVNLDATRREAASGNEPPEHGVMLRGAIRW